MSFTNSGAQYHQKEKQINRKSMNTTRRTFKKDNDFVTQLTSTRSKSTIETLEKRCEIFSKLTIKTPERRH